MKMNHFLFCKFSKRDARLKWRFALISWTDNTTVPMLWQFGEIFKICAIESSMRLHTFAGCEN